MKPRLLTLLAVLLPLGLTGCATHYSRALDEYKQADPLPFEQRTLQWTAESQRGNFASLLEPAEPSAALQERETGTTKSEFLSIAAELYQLPLEQLDAQFEHFRESAALDAHMEDQLDWDELKYAVALHNPAIHAAGERWKAALQQYDQAEYLEGLIAEFRTFTRYLNIEAGKPVHKKMTQSIFPLPSATSLRGEMVRRQVRIAELEWQQTLRDKVIESGEAFFEYQYLHRAEQTARENVALVDNLLSVIQERYRVGNASQPDLLKVQTELERQRNMLEDLRARRRAAVSRINSLLDRPANAALGLPGSEDLTADIESAEAFQETALQFRQEIRLQETRVSRMEVAIRMGEVMNRPLATQGYSLLERGMMPDASPGVSMPSFGQKAKTSVRPAYAQAEAYLAEMRERLDAARQALDQVRAATRALASARLEQLDVARREAQLITGIVLPQNRSAYETTLTAYTAGRASFLDLLDAERALLTARLEQHEARRALSVAILNLAAVRGAF